MPNFTQTHHHSEVSNWAMQNRYFRINRSFVVRHLLKLIFMEFLIDLKHKNTVFGVEYLTAELQLLIEFIDLD